MKFKFSIPDYITSIRIIGAICLLFLTPLSVEYFISYIVCGVSDVLDGFVARTFNCASEFGAKIDSVADLFFYTSMIITLFPIIYSRLPVWIWVLVCCILAVRLSVYLTVASKYKRFASLHTYLNKLSGLVIFFVPFVLKLNIFVVYCTVLCGVVFIASVEELFIHLLSPDYDTKVKSALSKIYFRKKV